MPRPRNYGEGNAYLLRPAPFRPHKHCLSTMTAILA